MMGKHFLNVALSSVMRNSKALFGSVSLNTSLISIFAKVSTNFVRFQVKCFHFSAHSEVLGLQ